MDDVAEPDTLAGVVGGVVLTVQLAVAGVAPAPVTVTVWGAWDRPV